MERFKQLQREKDRKCEVLEKSRLGSNTSVSSTPKTVISKATLEFKANSSHKTIQSLSRGKLAFSLKQKSKLVAVPVKFDEDNDERNGGNSSDDGLTKRPKLSEPGTCDQSLQHVGVVPALPGDPTVRKVADKLASFVAKNGRQFEHVTRQKNPGDTPFKFLFDENCSDYKYYLYQLSDEQKALPQSRDFQASQRGAGIPNSATSSQRSHYQHLKYQTPASALYESTEHMESTHPSSQLTSGRYGESSAPTGSDPVAMMEFYMKKDAQEEKLRPPKPSKDEMPPPASLQAPMNKGHHMGDYIPAEELEKFLSSCNDTSAPKAKKEHVDKAKNQADNVGHRLLSTMGWKEGEGLGSSKS